jgi:TonB-dependent SusC/RagA subfamily outer membrane receptor
MMLSLLVYGFIVALLIACAARVVEPLARAAGAGRRFVWLGAMALAIGLPAWRAYTVNSVATPLVARLPVPASSSALMAPAPRVGTLEFALATARGGFNTLIELTNTAVVRLLPAGARDYIAAGWMLGTAALLLLLLVVERRGRRRLESWPQRDIQGFTVRVSDSVGPAVIGLARPRIVVPGWLLEREAAEQRAALAHEQEHVRARDTWVLAAGCVVVALAPANPALWYMLARLRLSVEMDCDARVLRAGFAPRAYGELLISVAERASVSRPAALALSGGRSHLHQRILAMTDPVRRFAPMRFAAAAAVATFALMAACQAELPTQADVDQMTASTASTAASKLTAWGNDSGWTYTIDGRAATKAQADSLPASLIASLSIDGSQPGVVRGVRIETLRALDADGSAGGVHIVGLVPDRSDSVFVFHRAAASASPSNAASAVGGSGSTTFHRAARPAPVKFVDGKPVDFQGLVLVDGVKYDRKTLESLNGLDIASIEVLKGAAAAARYSDPAAAYGVILITTKH